MTSSAPSNQVRRTHHIVLLHEIGIDVDGANVVDDDGAAEVVVLVLRQ